MEELLSLAGETGGLVRHQTLTLKKTATPTQHVSRIIPDDIAQSC
jgi:hypothetical protein